jgi:hypothetical protein
VQANVLSFLMRRNPALTSVEEVQRELAPASDAFYQRDAVTEAIRDLVNAGLLHQLGDFVFPTVAAVRREALPH